MSATITQTPPVSSAIQEIRRLYSYSGTYGANTAFRAAFRKHLQASATPAEDIEYVLSEAFVDAETLCSLAPYNLTPGAAFQVARNWSAIVDKPSPKLVRRMMKRNPRAAIAMFVPRIWWFNVEYEHNQTPGNAELMAIFADLVTFDQHELAMALLQDHWTNRPEHTSGEGRNTAVHRLLESAVLLSTN